MSVYQSRHPNSPMYQSCDLCLDSGYVRRYEHEGTYRGGVWYYGSDEGKEMPCPQCAPREKDVP